jgi:2-methylcitrate dehydratase PrpD
VRCAHAPIDGAIELATKYNLDPAEVTEVKVYTNERVIDTAGKPFVIRTNPEVDAKFSIPYVVAVALTKKSVTLDDFEEATIRTSALAALAGRVKVVVDPEFKGTHSVVGPIKMEITRNNGEKLSTRIEFATGHLENPMSDLEFAEKFRDCVKYSAKNISREKVEHLLSMLDKLEEIENVGEAIRLTA